MTTPNQLPERLEVDRDGNLYFQSGACYSAMPFVPLDLSMAVCDRYNSHTALVAERDEAKEALRCANELIGHQANENDKINAALVRERDELKRLAQLQRKYMTGKPTSVEYVQMRQLTTKLEHLL